MIEQTNIDYKAELVRKSIHLTSLSIPVIYYFITRELALTLLLPITFAFLIVDVLRYYHKGTSTVFYRAFGWMLRTHESDDHTKRLNGATYVLISATLCVFVFPKIITITSFAILIISDSTAALVGRRFGKTKFLKKSAEGSAAFFLSALIVILLTPKLLPGAGEYFIRAVGAAVGTVIEALSIRVDDNLSIPISIATVLWILYAVVYPSLNLSPQHFSG